MDLRTSCCTKLFWLSGHLKASVQLHMLAYIPSHEKERWPWMSEEDCCCPFEGNLPEESGEIHESLIGTATRRAENRSTDIMNISLKRCFSAGLTAPSLKSLQYWYTVFSFRCRMRVVKTVHSVMQQSQMDINKCRRKQFVAFTSHFHVRSWGAGILKLKFDGSIEYDISYRIQSLFSRDRTVNYLIWWVPSPLPLPRRHGANTTIETNI
jgi:hypothetical protein